MMRIKKEHTLLITGAAGFIASCMASYLNQLGYENLILVDDFTQSRKEANHHTIRCIAKVQREDIETYLLSAPTLHQVIHLGARTDTTEMDYSIHEKLNYQYSITLWNYCTAKQIPFIYASSAATYGAGEHGYSDNHEVVAKLHPLNPYGESKQQFDLFVLQQKTTPPHWYGLKFFNVYGPNEYHKGRMASVIFHAYHQIKNQGELKLFRSHREDYTDGGQMRDFVYVKDLLSITFWLMQYQPENGLYNVGTGKAETFLQLGQAVFAALHLAPNIRFVDTPADIRNTYQYFTEADMSKLRAAGYTAPMSDLMQGVNDYITHYLQPETYFDGTNLATDAQA